MKYATEAYRRKKYDPVNGTRFWDYGEVWPGIRWGIIDYFRVPKMSYYSVKQAQERFALNFAYEQALESQVAGKRLQIPVWIINDYPQSFSPRRLSGRFRTYRVTLWEAGRLMCPSPRIASKKWE